MAVLQLMTKCGCQKFVIWNTTPDFFDVPIGSSGPEAVGTPTGVDTTLTFIMRRFKRIEKKDFDGDEIYLYLEE